MAIADVCKWLRQDRAAHPPDGDLVSIVTGDRVLSLLAGEMSAVAAMVGREQKREAGLRLVSI